MWALVRTARQRERPFFIAVGSCRLHTSFVAPTRDFDLYPIKRMPVVGGVEEDQRDIPGAALMRRKPEQDSLTDKLRRRCRQADGARITFMDVQLGRVLDELERHHLTSNAVIVFASGRGDHRGEHGR
ncbi:MAG: sulfatase-like hydrolase/transferase [Kiritimatiellae bacterium]|nr:sulfatase-like hydrolase/transferase [Kiritimatiellia bacterium]